MRCATGYDGGMSATTEALLEEIKQAETALKEAETTGDLEATGVLKQTLGELRARFNKAHLALNEGKVIRG